MTAPRPHLNPGGLRTRDDVFEMTPAEHHIHTAIRLVEGLGASERLTEAVVLLGKARELVADHVEGLP